MRLNSTMVRLKHYNQPTDDDYIMLSQFHYGSIKTQLFINKKGSSIMSQFHYGSIKTKPGETILEAINRVSIPLWFD